MKKVFLGLTVLALSAMMAVPALAQCWPSMQVSVGNDCTVVVNDVTAVSNTGSNGIANSQNQMGGFSGDISSNNDNNRIITGDATAYAGAANVVNSNLAVGGCCDGPEVQASVDNNGTKAKNFVYADSNTGGNVIAGSSNERGRFCGGNISSGNDGNVIRTGAAVSKAGAINIVNSNITRSW